MSDITIAVIFSLSALAMSLNWSGKVSIAVARTLSIPAMGLMGAHVLGVRITAPIASATADTFGIIASGWLLVATLALCVRGLRRPVNDKPALEGN